MKKIDVEFIKSPCLKVYIRFILCFYLNNPQLFFCLVIVVHEPLVCLLFFRKNYSGPTNSEFLCIWTLSNNDCVILRSIHLHRGQLRDSYANIKKGSNAHWCFTRKHNALMLKNEWDLNFFLKKNAVDYLYNNKVLRIKCMQTSKWVIFINSCLLACLLLVVY